MTYILYRCFFGWRDLRYLSALGYQKHTLFQHPTAGQHLSQSQDLGLLSSYPLEFYRHWTLVAVSTWEST